MDIKLFKGRLMMLFLVSLALAGVGITAFFALNSMLSLADEDLNVIDSIVFRELSLASKPEAITRDGQLYRLTKIGNVKSGYFTYTCTYRAGGVRKWRAYWTIHDAGADPVVSRIERLP